MLSALPEPRQFAKLIVSAAQCANQATTGCFGSKVTVNIKKLHEPVAKPSLHLSRAMLCQSVSCATTLRHIGFPNAKTLNYLLHSFFSVVKQRMCLSIFQSRADKNTCRAVSLTLMVVALRAAPEAA